MSKFNPSPNQEIVIGGHAYRVMPHPAVPTFAFGQEGRKAFVFQVTGGPDNGLYALKKFKSAYRVPELVEINNALARFSSWPGLEACQRVCFQHSTHQDALSVYPDLEYAVLMPWISGRTWYDIVINMTPLSRLEALTFANAIARVLSALEESSLAHCDIAAANVIVNGTTGNAHLIDVEDIYAPAFAPPAALPAGTDGYAHKTSPDGQWEPAADRFAGAVLIAEMLAWHVPEVRKEADEEHYFGTNEMQIDSPRYQLMSNVLSDITPELGQLFEQAWYSDTLEECPRLKEWQEVIETAYNMERLSKVVSDWKPLVPPGSELEMAEAAPASPPPPPPSPPAEVSTVPEPILQPELEVDEEEVLSASQPEVQPQPVAQQSPPSVMTPIASPPPSSVAPPAIKPAVAEGSSGPVREWRALSVPSSSDGASIRFRSIEAPFRPDSVSEPVKEMADEPELSGSNSVIEEHAITEEVEGIPGEEVDHNTTASDYHVNDQLEGYDNVEEVISDFYDDEPLSPLKPVLTFSHFEENRPALAWSQVQGAGQYEIEESDHPDFDNSKRYTVDGVSTFWIKPRRLGRLWRRSDTFYYRVRALVDGEPGAWSDEIIIQFGEG